MPITAVAGDAYQVTIEGRIHGQLTNNVFHLVAANSDSDVLLHMVQVLVNCFIQNLLPALSTQFNIERVRWQQVSPILGVEQFFVPAGNTQGGTLGDSQPSFVAAVMSKRTLQGGRSKRGRMYIPGVPESETTNSTISNGGALDLALIAFAACLINNFKPGDPPAANSWSLCVYSRKIGGSKTPFGAAGFTQIEALLPVSQLGTCRQRKVGRGA